MKLIGRILPWIVAFVAGVAVASRQKGKDAMAKIPVIGPIMTDTQKKSNTVTQ